MTAPHFFVDRLAGVEAGATLTLGPDDSRHALRALRLRADEELTLADGTGGFARARLIGPREGLAAVEVLEVEPLRPRPVPRLTVAMAPPKGDRLSWAVQKLAEVGVDELDLLTDADRAVRDVEGERRQALEQRLRRVAREAAMQSRRAFVMDVGSIGFGDALETAGVAVVLLWEGATEPLVESLTHAAATAGAPAGVRLVVGPEGGFSEQEVDRARIRGAALASLGQGILRTETAALAGAVIALSKLGRLG